MLTTTSSRTELKPYLAASTYIDWQHPAVLGKARELAAGLSGDADIARACFLFVRDAIRHSWDYRLNPVTCAVSSLPQPDLAAKKKRPRRND